MFTINTVNFHALKVRVSKAAIPWPIVPLRRASVNSFGYGGSNAHVVLDEGRGFAQGYQTNHTSSYMTESEDFFADEITERPKVLVFSANDDVSLKAYSKATTKHLINPAVNVKLRDLAYTLSERRTHHFHRAYVVATNTSLDDWDFTFGKMKSNPPRIGFVFTGQGAQWSQMGKGFVETFPAAKVLLGRLDHVLQSLPSPPMWSLLGKRAMWRMRIL
jgi:acyl transferase domain-containing protein